MTTPDEVFVSLWCERHWAPVPVLGRDGVVATLDLMWRQMEAMPDEVVAGGAEAISAYLAAQTVPFCCQIGDDEVASLWED